MRFFNTAGPVIPEMHYCIPPLNRIDVDDFLLLIRQRKYFVLRAPHQTGKTSVLMSLRDELNLGDEFRCVHVNFGTGQAAGETVREGVRGFLSALARAARDALDDDFVAKVWPETLARVGPYGAIAEILNRWSHAADKPLVLLVDGTDALMGDTLLSVLRQLRAGYPDRPQRFPQSVILCGVRDVRDYRIRSTTENGAIAGGSVFNISAASLRLEDFSRDDVESLLNQSGGRIEREYGLGRGRTDLLIVWPIGERGANPQAGQNRQTQKVVVECKMLHRGPEATLREGLEQTREYMDRCTAAEGHLVIFDRTEGRSWDDKIYRREETESGAPVTVWGM